MEIKCFDIASCAFCSVRGWVRTSCIIRWGQRSVRLPFNCGSLPWPEFIDPDRLNLACSDWGLVYVKWEWVSKYRVSGSARRISWFSHHTLLLHYLSTFYQSLCLAPEPEKQLLTMLLRLDDVLWCPSQPTQVKSLHSTALQCNLNNQLKSGAWKNLHSFVWSPLRPEQYKTY